MVLSDWKIKAIKVCVYVEKHGRIDRATFRALKIDPSRWMNGLWLERAAERGVWRPGRAFPADTYRRTHPKTFAQIEADYESWANAAKIANPKAPEGLAG